MASEYGKEYHRKAESLLSDFLLGLPGLPVEMQNKTSPQFETALSFAMGHALHSASLDVDKEIVKTSVEGLIEKLVLHGHVRSAEKMNDSLKQLDGKGQGWLKEHYLTMSMLLGIAQAPTATGSHFNKFEVEVTFNDSTDKDENNKLLLNQKENNENKSDAYESKEEEDDAILNALITASLDKWGEDCESDSDDGLWFDDSDDEETEDKVENRNDDDEDGMKIEKVVGNRREERKIQKALQAIDLNSTTTLVSMSEVEKDESGMKEEKMEEEKQQQQQQESEEEEDEDEEEDDDDDDEEEEYVPSIVNVSQYDLKFNEFAERKRRLLAKKFGTHLEASNAKLSQVKSSPLFEENKEHQNTMNNNNNNDSNTINRNIGLNHDLYNNFKFSNSQEIHFHDKGLKNVLLSESEAIRACIHVLLGVPGPLFHFNQSTSNATSSANSSASSTTSSAGSTSRNVPWCVSLSKWLGSGDQLDNGFMFNHLSSKSLTLCLSSFAQHATDLRFLREVIINNGQNLGRVWGAWKNVVAEWMSECDKQLSELDKVAYLLMKSTTSTSTTDADTAADTADGKEDQVTSTLIRLSTVLKSSARRASQLRLLCHKLNPYTMNATYESSTTTDSTDFKGGAGGGTNCFIIPTHHLKENSTKTPNEIILKNVMFTCHIINELWNFLTIAEISSMKRNYNTITSTESIEPKTSYLKTLGKLPQAPPLVDNPDWLRNSFNSILKPMIDTWSSWILEGILNDVNKEFFLSLHIESLFDYHGSNIGKTATSYPLGGAGSGIIKIGNKTSSNPSNPSSSSKNKSHFNDVSLPPLNKQVPNLFSPCASLILTSGQAVRLMRASKNRIEKESSHHHYSKKKKDTTLYHDTFNRKKFYNNDEDEEDEYEVEEEAGAGGGGEKEDMMNDGESGWTDSMQWIEHTLLDKLINEKKVKKLKQQSTNHEESDDDDNGNSLYSLIDLFQACCSSGRFLETSSKPLNDDDELKNTIFYDEEDSEDDEEDDDDEEDVDDDDDNDEDEEEGEEIWGGEWEEHRGNFSACEQFQDIKHFTERKVAAPFLPALYSKHASLKNKQNKKQNIKNIKNTMLLKKEGEEQKLLYSNTANVLHYNFIIPIMKHCQLANQCSAQELLKFGGQGKDLISAFQVLRSIYLGSDGLLLNTWREEIFMIGNNHLNTHDSDSFDVNSDDDFDVFNPWMGLKDPLNMDANHLSNLFRSSILDAVAISRGGFEQTRSLSSNQNHHHSLNKTSKHYHKGNSNNSNNNKMNGVYDKFDQNQFNSSLIGGSLPLWFIDGENGLNTSESMNSNNNGVLNLDNFHIELMPSASASNKQRKRDIYLKKHVLSFNIGGGNKLNIDNVEEEGSILLPAPLYLPSVFKHIYENDDEGKAKDDDILKQSILYSSSGNGGDFLYGGAGGGGGPSSNDLSWSDGIKQLGWMRLNCSIGWPLNAVVSKQSLNAYNKIWILLQQVRYAHVSLESFRWLLHKERKREGLLHVNNQLKKDTSSNDSNDNDSNSGGHNSNNNSGGNNGGSNGYVMNNNSVNWHKISVQLGLVIHVLTSLQSYLCNHSAVEHWPTLIVDLESAESVEELKQAHDIYLLKILERCMLLPRASKVLEYVLKVISGGLKFATLGTSLRTINKKINHINKLNNDNNNMEYQQQSPADRPRSLSSLQSTQMMIASMLEECYDSFKSDLKFVNAVGERLVVTRLAPYLEDVLLILDYNNYFEKHLNY